LFAVGHFSFGYLISVFSARLLKTKISIPIVLTLSVIPDSDILVEKLQIPYLTHRGLTHSVITAIIVFMPFFAIYRKKAIPPFLAFAQHALIGDFLTGGSQLLWPLTTQQYGIGLNIRSPTSIALEWLVFLVSIIVMLKTKDMATFFKSQSINLILLIPLFTVLLPTVLSFPLGVPLSLIPPHLGWMLLFSASIIIDLFKPFKSSFKL